VTGPAISQAIDGVAREFSSYSARGRGKRDAGVGWVDKGLFGHRPGADRRDGRESPHRADPEDDVTEPASAARIATGRIHRRLAAWIMARCGQEAAMPDTILITGASAGLGADFARALAKKPVTLILTARRADRLTTLARELERRPGIEVHVIPADLGQAEGVKTLIDGVRDRGLSVDTLINNAGFGALGDFADSDLATQMGMIDLNIRALVTLTHALLPPMLARGRGGVLNVASTAAFQPGPYMAIYYASKAFVLHFSEALHEEVKGRGVTVTALCPGPTRTEFADVAGMAETPLFERFAGTSEQVVRDGLAALERGQAVMVSGLLNRLTAASARIAPRGVLRRAVGRLQSGRR
jgi:short-subunit dehydrogenase